MSALVGNHNDIVGFPTRRLIFFVHIVIILSVGILDAHFFHFCVSMDNPQDAVTSINVYISLIRQ